MLNYLYKKTNKYQARYLEAEKFIAGVPKNLQVGCFGSSYARFGFDFSKYEIRGFNFGVFPQPLQYDYVILKHYIDCFQKGAYVIFTFPPLVFALYRYENDTMNYKYYKFLNKNEIQNYSWKTKFFEIDYPVFRHPGFIKRIWNDDDCIRNRIFWETEKSLGDRKDAERFAQERVDGWCQQFGLNNLKDSIVHDDIQKVFDKNRRILKDMLNLCEEHCLQPVWVIPPVSKCLKNHLSQQFLQAYLYENLQAVANTKVILLDYYNDKEYEDYTLYSNADFMNKVGRKKFTERVINDLYSHKITEMSKEKCTG